MPLRLSTCLRLAHLRDTTAPTPTRRHRIAVTTTPVTTTLIPRRRMPMAVTAWRQWSPHRITEMVEFNDWIRRNASDTEPPMELLETADRSAAQTADDVAAWVSRGLASACLS